MAELFDKKLLRVVPPGTDWKRAVKTGVAALEQAGFAKEELAEAVFAATAKLGAYYVLEKGIALVHAPVGPYSIKPAVSLVFCPEDIQFNNEEKWAHLIFVLSAPNATDHLSIIQEFGRVFTDEELKAKLLSCKTAEELFERYNETK